ncbi:MAG: hypothetical protein QXW79_03310 [Thermoplasmata archaeon]|jgi:hypothetical protein
MSVNSQERKLDLLFNVGYPFNHQPITQRQIISWKNLFYFTMGSHIWSYNKNRAFEASISFCGQKYKTAYDSAILGAPFGGNFFYLKIKPELRNLYCLNLSSKNLLFIGLGVGLSFNYNYWLGKETSNEFKYQDRYLMIGLTSIIKYHYNVTTNSSIGVAITSNWYLHEKSEYGVGLTFCQKIK